MFRPDTERTQSKLGDREPNGGRLFSQVWLAHFRVGKRPRNEPLRMAQTHTRSTGMNSTAMEAADTIPPLPPGKGRVFGHAVPRLEDAPLVRGQGLFADDVNFPRQLAMRVVRSPVAHGLLIRIDVAAALAAPGVISVWTGSDVANIPPIPLRAARPRGMELYRQPILPRERVRYVGEAIAVVFAENPYLAEDAADLVTADIEALPTVLDAAAEPTEFLPGISTEATLIQKQYGAVDAAFRNAHAVIELELSIGRHSGVPLETRGAVARYIAATDVIELHGTSDKQHLKREELARLLSRPLPGLHLYDGHIGGGFQAWPANRP
jgi:aerobic carbon-monoxide dehydrogenase large subunit